MAGAPSLWLPPQTTSDASTERPGEEEGRGDGQGEGHHHYYSLTHLLLTSITLGAVILMTVVGNVFVIAAIVLERNLRSVANYLIASLANSALAPRRPLPASHSPPQSPSQPVRSSHSPPSPRRQTRAGSHSNPHSAHTRPRTASLARHSSSQKTARRYND